MSDQKPKRKLRIHLLVEDAAGPNVSRPVLGSLPVGGRAGQPTRWRFACDAAGTLGNFDRGTGEPWGVRCDACKASDLFKAVDRPKPAAPGDEQMVADGSGCC